MNTETASLPDPHQAGSGPGVGSPERTGPGTTDRDAAAPGTAGRRFGPRRLLAALLLAAAIVVAIVIATGGQQSEQLFAPTSVWNTPIPANAPLDPNSATYVSELDGQVAHYGPWFNTTQYSVPIYTVGRSQATTRVSLDPAAGSQPDLQQAWSAVPLPADAQPAGGSDGSLVVWQPSTDKMWEFWQLHRGASGWSARWGGYMPSVSKNPGYYVGHSDWGSSATSLPAAAGLVRISELRSGHIDHALALALAQTSSQVYSWPAERTDGNDASPQAIPEGTRFRLDPSLNIAKLHLPRFTRMLAYAAQRYGLIVHDRATLVVMSGEDPTQYGTNPYLGPKGFFGGMTVTALMKKFPWSHLQALRTSLHRVTP